MSGHDKEMQRILDKMNAVHEVEIETEKYIIGLMGVSKHRGIKCKTCGMVSCNAHDVDEKYCGDCHVFHDDVDRDGSTVTDFGGGVFTCLAKFSEHWHGHGDFLQSAQWLAWWKKATPEQRRERLESAMRHPTGDNGGLLRAMMLASTAQPHLSVLMLMTGRLPIDGPLMGNLVLRDLVSTDVAIAELKQELMDHLVDGSMLSDDDLDRSIGFNIEMWANAASDHFYELDKDKAPDCLARLADMVLTMGHGYTGRRYTLEDVAIVERLWRQSIMACDQAVFATEVDWGRW